MCAEPARLGILGGTFDPVHLGHLASAREVAVAFGLERVLLVLSARPPHKADGDHAPADLRWRMLELAVAEAGDGGAGPAPGDVELEACDVELLRDGPSWTVDTLGEIARRHPRHQLFLILGDDAWRDVDTWSRPDEIPALAHVVVTSRPGTPWSGDPPKPPVAARGRSRYDPAIGAYVHTSGHRIEGFQIHGLEVSATDIRRRVRAGLPIDHLTGAAVARFISDHGLYHDDGAAGTGEC